MFLCVRFLLADFVGTEECGVDFGNGMRKKRRRTQCLVCYWTLNCAHRHAYVQKQGLHAA